MTQNQRIIKNKKYFPLLPNRKTETFFILLNQKKILIWRVYVSVSEVPNVSKQYYTKNKESCVCARFVSRFVSRLSHPPMNSSHFITHNRVQHITSLLFVIIWFRFHPVPFHALLYLIHRNIEVKEWREKNRKQKNPNR